jgi:transposase
MAAWLMEMEVDAVAMESTGVYWKPVWNVLEEYEANWELLLVNAKHVKQVPGRKTDVKDAEWLAELLRHGLLNASRIPDRAQRELRDMTRFRRALIQNRSHEVQRLQKILESANIKLDSVLSDVMGVSGKAMLKALIDGETQPEKLASLAHRQVKATPEALSQALEGAIGEAHRFVLKVLLENIEHLDEQIKRMDSEIARQMNVLAPLPPDGGGGQAHSSDAMTINPETGEVLSQSETGVSWSQAVELLDGIPGVAVRSAQEILAEIGIDMSHFPSSKHLTSWAKVSPGNNESGGKRRSGRTGKGNKWLKAILVEISWAAVRKKGSYYKALYGRLSGRRGKKRAILAVARSILEAIYYMLKRKEAYRELGDDHYDLLRRDRIKRQAVNRLQKLGYDVSLQNLVEAS